MSCTCEAIRVGMDPEWEPTEAVPHHPDCPQYVVTAAAIRESTRVEPKGPPLPLSSFTVHHGLVSEVSWTSEDDVLRWLRVPNTHEARNEARLRLRRAAKLGAISARRHPEHGYWEYGPQWRRKDLPTLLDAAEAAARLGG